MKLLLMSQPMIKAVRNTLPDTWPAVPIDQSLPFKWQTRRCIKTPPPQDAHVWQEDDGLWHWHNNDAEGLVDKNGRSRLKVGDVVALGESVRVVEIGPLEFTVEYVSDGQTDGLSFNGWTYKTPAVGKSFGRGFPRELARTFVRITEVRAQKVQRISEEDAIAEGQIPEVSTRAIAWQGYDGRGRNSDEDLRHTSAPGTEPPDWMIEPKRMTYLIGFDVPAKAKFRNLWEHLNGNWDENPWVWAYSFARLSPEVAKKEGNHVLAG